MGFRINSLKTKTALATSAVIVLLLVANAVYLIVTKRSELREKITKDAEHFARLTKAPLCTAYGTYYASGLYKFRELVRDYMTMAENIDRVQIVTVNGKVLFDSADLDQTGDTGAGVAESEIRDPIRLRAIKGLEQVKLEGRDARGNDTLEIIAPHLEEWGRHRLSVSYHVTYATLGPSTRNQIYATLGLTLVSIVLSTLTAVALATRITRPLAELTQGAREITVGRFGERLEIRSGDELQVLADAFNHMSATLRENLEQLEESNKKLASVNEELKELDRMKSDLLANVSHELRTPLTAIKGYTDYILDRKLGGISDKQEKGLVVVQRNLERLARSINALLDFSRMETGKLSLNVQPFGLERLADSILAGLKSEFEKKQLKVAVEIEPGLGAILADREKVSQVLENLLINAMKFTPEGGQIALGARRITRAGRPAAEIRVTDTGIGIAKDQMDKIFMRFHQVDGSTTRRFGGVGLGLAIVKAILEAHGVPIEVESEEGQGTSFRFHLPLMPEDPARDPEPAGPRVLVIDDDPGMLRLLRGYFEGEGVGVLSAASAAEGADLAQRGKPDLILLDVLLPDRNGLELLRSLKEDDATSAIPVIVLSVKDESERSASLGAAEWLIKPIDKTNLLTSARRILAGAYPAPAAVRSSV